MDDEGLPWSSPKRKSDKYAKNGEEMMAFLQLPILYSKANVERPSIEFKLSNRKGCLILSIESKHRLPNFQLVFHQLFWLDAKT
jgi:hypothetical protein